MNRRQRDDGSILPLVALWLAGLVLVATAIVGGTGAVVARARAQAAADAIALAGAAEGLASAQAVAEANDGRIVSYDERSVGDGVVVVPLGSAGRSDQVLVEVTVVVEVDGATATAAAERFLPSGGFPTGP